MSEIQTKNYWKKKLVRMLFNERQYHAIKFYKILFDFKSGKNYEPFIDRLPGIIAGKGTVLDIGANMGQYMMPLARKFPSSAIISAEPVPINYKYLCKAREILEYSHVQCVDIAFSETSGREKIVVPYLNGIPVTTRSVLRSSMNYQSKEKLVEIDIQTTTIDDFVASRGLANLTFIKIDTEGAEDRVLKGGRKAIMSQKPVLQLETSPDNPEVRLLLQEGYEAFYFINGKLVPVSFEYSGSDIILISKTLLPA